MSDSILDNVIVNLDFINGDLQDASPFPTTKNKSHWLEKGDWIRAAAHADVQKVFLLKIIPL
jgi:ribosome modulation factor